MRDRDAKCTVPCDPPADLVQPAQVHWLLRAAHSRLVVLTAPAGSGKTALLAAFAHHAPLPLVWYSLERRDREGWTFVDGLVRACRQPLPTSCASTAALLATRPRPSLAVLRSALLDDVAGVAGDTTLVLDNWHLVDGVRVCAQIVEHVLAHCPRWHIILAGRTTPSLQHMLLLAATGQLCGMDATGLRRGSAPLHGGLAGRARRVTPAPVWSTRRDGTQHQHDTGLDVSA